MVAVTVSLSHQNHFQKKIYIRDQEKMYEYNDSYHLVIGACEMQRIRNKICELYPDKNIMLAPCLSKLYISRELKMFDFDGKTSPNWFYFGTGIISVIYDSDEGDIMLALFNETDVRLLWCLKWADFIKFQTQTSNFHILNTKEDSSHHVGILYDNKDVADLIFNTVNMIFKNLNKVSEEKTDCECESEKPTNKNKLFKSLSLRRLKRGDSFKKESSNEKSEPTIKRKISLRDSIRKKTGWRKGKQASIEEAEKLEDEKMNHLTSLRRTSSFRHALKNDNTTEKNNASETETSSENNNNIESKCKRLSLDGDDTNEKESIRRKIFKLRRISRTRSLIAPKRDSQVSEISPDDVSAAKEEEGKYFADKAKFLKPKRVVKQRSSTDTLILHDKTMRYVIDAAHVARYARERKYLLKNMNSVHLEGTDLCVTEL